MKTKSRYVYEIHPQDGSDKYTKSFTSHSEAEEYVGSLKKVSAYDQHYLKVNSHFSHVTVTLV